MPVSSSFVSRPRHYSARWKFFGALGAGTNRVGVSLALAFLASCAPLPVTYYVPSGEGAKVVQARCDQAPPYMAKFEAEKVSVTAFFGGTSLMIGIFPKHAEHIVIDPASLVAEADGLSVPLLNLRYWTVGSSADAVQPAVGAVGTISTGLYLGADISPSNPAVFKLRIPDFAAGEESIRSRSVEFHRDRRVKLRFLIINC